MYDNGLKQRKIKLKPRIKWNQNMCTNILNVYANTPVSVNIEMGD